MQTLVERRIYPFLLMVFILLAILSFQIRQFKRLYEHIKNDKWVVVIFFFFSSINYIHGGARCSSRIQRKSSSRTLVWKHDSIYVCQILTGKRFGQGHVWIHWCVFTLWSVILKERVGRCERHRSLFSKKTTFKASVTLAWRLVYCSLFTTEKWTLASGRGTLLAVVRWNRSHRTAHKTSLSSLLLWADFRCSACHLSANSLTRTTNGGRWSSSQTFYFKVAMKKKKIIFL